MNNTPLVIAACVCLVSLSVLAENKDEVTKKSRNAYCHYKTSSYYEKVKNFQAFNTLQSCLNSGGTIPPGPDSKLAAPPRIKFSRSGICHDKSSEWFTKTNNFVSMNSMEDCLEQGGRKPFAPSN